MAEPVDILRDALFGNPASSVAKPSREGVLAAFTMLYDTAVVAQYAASAGIMTVSTLADRDTFYSVEANRGKLVYVNNNNGSGADAANGVYEYVGGTPRIAQGFYGSLSASLTGALDLVDDTATAAALTGELLTGIDNTAVPINGNGSEMRTDAPGALSGQPFKALIVKDASSATSYLTSGSTRLRIANGGGVTIPPETLTAGTIAEFQYSAGGQIFVLNSAEPFGESTAIVSADDPDYKTKPYGTVTFSGNTRTITPIDKYIVVPGSSNAAEGYVPAGLRPAELIVSALNAAFPGSGINFIPDTRAVQGAPFTAVNGQLDQSVAFAIGNARWVVPFFWMNDCRSIFYHDYGGVQAQIAMIEPLLERVKKKNAELILVTGFNPDPRFPNIALDPQYFAQNSDRSMVFPATKAAPVDPETQMTPPASGALVQRDWSGNGVLRTGYTRIWHFNRMVRREAARLGLVVWDFEKSTSRNCIEMVPDLSTGLNTFFDPGDANANPPRDPNPLHPLGPMYNLGVKPPIDAWAKDVAAGDTSRRVYTGF